MKTKMHKITDEHIV